jgi:hypothetical protein
MAQHLRVVSVASDFTTDKSDITTDKSGFTVAQHLRAVSVAGDFTTDKSDFTTDKSGFPIRRSTCVLCPSLALLTALWGRATQPCVDSWSVRRCRCCRCCKKTKNYYKNKKTKTPAGAAGVAGVRLELVAEYLQSLCGFFFCTFVPVKQVN